MYQSSGKPRNAHNHPEATSRQPWNQAAEPGGSLASNEQNIAVFVRQKRRFIR